MNELTIARMARTRIPTAEGEFHLCLYRDLLHAAEHLALVFGNVVTKPDVLVRVHSECFTGDVLGSLRCDCGEQLDRSVKLIAQEGSGVLIYLRQEGRGIGLLDKLRAYNLQDQGYDTVDANLLLGHRADERDYTVAALILKDLDVPSVRLLTNNPAKVESLQVAGIPVTARVPLPPRVTAENAAYLLTKAQRLRHLLHLDSFADPLARSGNGSETGTGHSTRLITPASARSGDEIETRPGETTERIPASLIERIEALRRRSADHHQHTGLPLVTLSYAQSVDGCIAARAGQQLALSGSLSLILTHKLRAAHDAILVGIGTVLADNPRLTVRLVEGKNPQPVVADSRLRFPLNANLLHNHPLSPWIATSQQADEGRQQTLDAAGARVLRLPTNMKGQVHLAALLERLGALGVRSVMVEGGARIITSVLADRLVNQMVLTVAPTLVGGLRAVRTLGQSDAVHLPRLRNLHYQQLEEDLVLWGDTAWGEE